MSGNLTRVKSIRSLLFSWLVTELDLLLQTVTSRLELEIERGAGPIEIHSGMPMRLDRIRSRAPVLIFTLLQLYRMDQVRSTRLIRRQ